MSEDIKKIVLIKLSSMGDIIHALPVVADIKRAEPKAHITWIVDAAFAELLSWHPDIDTVIALPLRALIKQKTQIIAWRRLWVAMQKIRKLKATISVDLQGLVKSAVVTWLAGGMRHGQDRASARESLAALAYHQAHAIPKQQHAVVRNRQLAKQALGLPTDLSLDYGLQKKHSPSTPPFVLFFHGTTWPNKHWPLSHWQRLAKEAIRSGYTVVMPWSNDEEKKRAEAIVSVDPKAITCLPKGSLTDLKNTLAKASGSISLDTGLGHLAAALSVPNVAIFGPTSPERARPFGKQQKVYQSDALPCIPCIKRFCRISDNPHTKEPPCMLALAPQAVWQTFMQMLEHKGP